MKKQQKQNFQDDFVNEKDEKEKNNYKININ